MKFFLYGDHLNPTQLKRRAPEHHFLMLATLPEHTIKFCRWSSQWRCGLASVTPSPGEQVWGAVFEVTDEDLKGATLFTGEGCDKCMHTGFYGRTGIYEIMKVTESIKRTIISTSDANAIKDAAVLEGMRTLRQDGSDKIMKGITTPEEILRVTQV